MAQPPGNDLDLGKIAGSNTPLIFPRGKRATHLYLCGSTGTGKSKFMENMLRQDIEAWPKHECGLLLLDPHGSLYDGLMRWMAWNKISVPVTPIDLRRDDWIVGYNVLRHRPDSDPAVLVTNFVQAMAYVWGQSDTKATPLFARCASNILSVLYEKKLTLLEAEYLIYHETKAARLALTQDLQQESLAVAWASANRLSAKDYDAQISSTVNRLHSFLSTQLLRRMFGQLKASLELEKALEEGHIILVNLATEKNRISKDDSSLFATLLLSDLWAAAQDRGKGTDERPVKPFYVYIDEFQNFVTPTIAENLDQARGFGLHLTLANQFPKQILHTGAHGPAVYDSVFANARSKVAFETRGEENLRTLALDLFMGTMNPDKIKRELYSTKVMEYREELREVRGESVTLGRSRGSQRGSATGSGTGGTAMLEDGEGGNALAMTNSESQFSSDSESDSSTKSLSVTESKSYVPTSVSVMGKELAHVQFATLEEQIFCAMAVLHDQEQRHCVARLVGMKAPASIVTPPINALPATEARSKRFLEACYAKLPFVLSSADAQKQLDERKANFAASLRKTSAAEAASAKRKLS